MRKYGVLIFPVLCAVFGACSSASKQSIFIENSCFSYEIGKDGKNLHFIDKTDGADYLDTGTSSFCSYLTLEGKEINVTSVSRKRKKLILDFKDAGVTAEIHITEKKDQAIMEVASISRQVESLTFLNIPLSLEAMPYESFAACALSMNLFTQVRQLPALQTRLRAACYERFGIEGAKITLLAVPQENILPVIRDVMEHADDIPFSDKGGAWAQMQKEGYGSYLMNFGTLTEETVDEWIEMCRSLGFNQLDNHGGGEFFRFGDFELNREKWPDGWDSFKRINDRLHEAGISSIFHTYAFFIDKNTRYVTPVPSEDLGYFSSFTLKAPLDTLSDEVFVNEPTGGISTITGFFVRNSITLRIGNELITFSGTTDSPPYKFTGCRRGANGTRPSVHQTGEEAFHLREMFGRFVPGPETALFAEVARRTAEIVSRCGFDGLYFDAIDGSDILGGEENFWYYGTKFIFEVARQLEHPVGMEMSSMSHHWWHYRSRWQAWDRPVRGYKRFIDIHSAAIKSMNLSTPVEYRPNEFEHGMWRGHTPMIDRYSPARNGSLLLPLHLGWWGNQTWNPPQVEPTFPDDVEYLCCKMIGNNAGISMLGGAEKKNLYENPLFARLVSIIRQYEELRQKNYFNDTIRALLRQPGKEYTLFMDDADRWNLRPVSYDKHKVTVAGNVKADWIINNKFGTQPVKLRIEPLMSVKPYYDPAGITIAGFSGSPEFTSGYCATGISGGFQSSSERTTGGEKTGNYRAESSGLAPQEGSWIKVEKNFDPWIDMSKNQALGVWIRGDGNGELLNFRIESPGHISFGAHGDHFVKIDFKGWKYFELVETESSGYSNYIWPDSGFYVYDSYRTQVQFGSISKLQLWYNGLPSGKDVSCLIGPVRALPLVAVPVENPSVTIGNETIVFPVRMEPGMFLEFNSTTDCRLFGTKGELIKEVIFEGTIPSLRAGENKVSFRCKPTEQVNPRFQVTVISYGEPL